MIEWEELKSIQSEIKGHLRGLNLVFNTGEDHGEKGRSRACAAKEMAATSVPLATLLAKDHKNPEVNGDPKTRPVCSASRSPNGELSEWTSDITDAAIEAPGTSLESIGIEELLSMVDKVAEEIGKENLGKEDLFIGSLDVEALYPSLYIPAVSKLCAGKIVRSGLNFEGVDYVWAFKYVALGIDMMVVRRRGLQDVMPSRSKEVIKH